MDRKRALNDVGEDADDIASNQSTRPTLADVIEVRLSRREALGSLLGSIAATSLPVTLLNANANAEANVEASGGAEGSSLTFEEIDRRLTERHRVSPGYRAEVLLRWGDPLFEDAQPFDPHRLRADEHEKQFGYNCDFIAFLPLPRGSDNSTSGLLCVNHEYTNHELMWPGITSRHQLSADQVAYEMNTHGHSVVEIVLEDGRWRPVVESAYNRRITALTPIRFAGPAAGHERMKTMEDPAGTKCLGTINNCAGGFTPWGTVLIAEENFNYYFKGDLAKTNQETHHARYGLDARLYNWGVFHRRFDLEREPNEPNRFGWVVEFDPYDPDSTPVKRTALGRFKHEGATVVVNHDGRVVVYSGDDQRYEYVYKFVSSKSYDKDDPATNTGVLDDGTLFVAQFHADGTCRWLPLVWGEGPLTVANGFRDQGEVLIETRRAADLLGATPMDRPEDIEPNPVTGKVYIMLTKNPKRTEAQIDAANPRAVNRFGHIIELEPPPPPPEIGSSREPDHGATTFRWNIFLQAGDPDQPEHGAVYHPDVSRSGWLVNPDNAAFDNKGRLWIATDQGELQAENDIADGMWVCDTEGEGRALTRMFFACPVGAEMCGPCFTPDGTTIFLAVQHPGEGSWAKPSSFEHPLTRWPDFEEGVPPRPSVVAVRREDGREIGG